MVTILRNLNDVILASGFFVFFSSAMHGSLQALFFAWS